MQLLNKVGQNRKLIIAGSIAALLIGAGMFYKKKDNDQQDKMPVELSKEAQIEKVQPFKGYMPSIESLIGVIKLSMTYSDQRIRLFSQEFRKKRRQYDSVARKAEFNDYLLFILDSIKQVKKISKETQDELMNKSNLSESHFVQYEKQLGVFLQDEMNRLLTQENHYMKEDMSVKEYRRCLQLQTEYLAKNGENLGEEIKKATREWSLQDKLLLPSISFFVLADQVFEKEADFDQDQFQRAQEKYQNQCREQLQVLRQAFRPLLQKLNQIMNTNIQVWQLQNDSASQSKT